MSKSKFMLSLICSDLIAFGIIPENKEDNLKIYCILLRLLNKMLVVYKSSIIPMEIL